MESMGLEPNVGENHPYKVSEKFSDEEGEPTDGLIWIVDVDPTKEYVDIEYGTPDDFVNTSMRLSDIKEVGEDYIKFKWD